MARKRSGLQGAVVAACSVLIVQGGVATIADNRVRVATVNTHRNPAGGKLLDGTEVLSMEVRGAINYQTEVLANVVNALTKALKDEVSSVTEVIPSLLSDLQDVNLAKDEARRAAVSSKRLEVRMAKLEAQAQGHKKEIRRLKREAKSSKEELKAVGRQLNSEVLKLKVFFDAARHTGFATAGNLTYDAAVVNRGSALDPESGSFVAPVAGTYLFSFHANTVKGNDGLVLLRHNGDILAGAFDTDNFKHNTLALTALAPLRVGDVVWVEVLSGGVRSNDNLYVHFVGMLLNADLEET